MKGCKINKSVILSQTIKQKETEGPLPCANTGQPQLCWKTERESEIERETTRGENQSNETVREQTGAATWPWGPIMLLGGGGA